VTALDRFGKYLVARLDDGSRLVLHLGMTGQVFASGVSSVRLRLRAPARAARSAEAQPARPDAHTHLRLAFADPGPQVWLRDVRKLGKALWLPPGAASPRLERLGADALAVRGADLHRASRGRRVAVKSLLLDQGVIAGVGNIYADEALHRARVRPTRPAGRLTRLECERIAAALRSVLTRAIATGGSTVNDFVAPDGRDGAYQDEHDVYAREGQPCRACGASIRRVVIGQRSAHYCRRCQR
jgi:formamidopyrimidine-DNA glycosylase